MVSKTQCRIALAAAIVLLVAFIYGLSEKLAEREETALAVTGGARVTHILGPLDFAVFGTVIAPDFGVTSDASVVFKAGHVLHVVTKALTSPSDVTEIALLNDEVPDSFALDPRGTMLTVGAGYFGVLNENGRITHSVPLPYDGARLGPSVHEGATYLFGGGKNNYRLYRFIDDGALQILLESEEPIIAAADNQSAVYAATASAIMRIKAGSPEVLFRAPQDEFAGPIISIAVTADDIVIFATASKVYALLGQNAVSIVNNAGGSLRLRDGVLYVLDTRRKMLFAISPVTAKLFD